MKTDITEESLARLAAEICYPIKRFPGFWPEGYVREDFNVIVRILLLTGQRRSEVANMRWDDLQDNLWIIPPKFSKN
jgi:integrase